MKVQRKSVSTVLAAMIVSAVLPAGISVTAHAEETNQSAITSSRKFKPGDTVRKSLLVESTATTVDKDSNWGGVENLEIPHTKSQAEKDAEARAKAEEQSRRDAQARAAQIQREAASRSATRESVSAPKVQVAPPDEVSAAALVRYAVQFVNQVPYVSGGKSPSGWDCSGFVQYVYAQFGISAPAPSGNQARLGRSVPSISQAMPGDIIANGGHAAIYVGNGLVVNALSPGQGTQLSPISVAFTGGYSIRRLL